VKKLPIRRISFTTPPQERARLLEKARSMISDDQSCVLRFVEYCLSQEPQESDVVHDLLAFLAVEMIRLKQEKWTITKEFLDWLVTTLRILADKDGRLGINALTGKGRLMDYAGNYRKGKPPLAFGDLVEILRKNKGKLGVKLDDSGNGGLVDEIRGRYEESLGRVLSIKEQLRKTDRLIDEVVYRLYGLTQQEIEVVEGGREGFLC
jgi:hypothetical protein